MEEWLKTHHRIDQYYKFSLTDGNFLVSPVIATPTEYPANGKRGRARAPIGLVDASYTQWNCRSQSAKSRCEADSEIRVDMAWRITYEEGVVHCDIVVPVDVYSRTLLTKLSRASRSGWVCEQRVNANACLCLTRQTFAACQQLNLALDNDIIFQRTGRVWWDLPPAIRSAALPAAVSGSPLTNANQEAGGNGKWINP